MIDYELDNISKNNSNNQTDNQPIFYKAKIQTINRIYETRVEKEPKVFLIRLVNTDYGEIEIPSYFSGYIKNLSKSIGTQKTYAKVIAQFLNYVILQQNTNNSIYDDIREKGLRGLQWTHAADYLQTYCLDERENGPATSRLKSQVLIDFYDYLNTFGVINVPIEKIDYVDANGNPKTKTLNPFDKHEYRVIFPEEVTGTKKKKYMDYNVYKLFMEAADETYPELKLGIFLQTRAGLRSGEVVNCLVDSITVGEGERIHSVDVLDNQELLFGRGYEDVLETCQVKRQRYNQPIIDLDKEFEELYTDHLKLMNKRRKSYTPKGALFIDKNGNPISGVDYRNKFYSVKKRFLEKLEEKQYSKAHEYTKRPWGSHIGRAIFTNYCIIKGLCSTSDGIPSAKILAKLRGDRSETASLEYIEDTEIMKAREIKVNSLMTALNKRLDDVRNVA